MKKALIILLFLASAVVYATPYILIGIDSERVHIQYERGYEQLEINGKIHILIQLLDTLLQQKKETNLEIYLFFEQRIGLSDSSYYAVSFGQFEYHEKTKQGYYSSNKKKAEGLKFFIQDRILNINQIVNLVNSSIEQLDYIKANQKKYLSQKKG